MAQAVRKSVDVEELKEALQRQGIALSAAKAAGLATAIETRLAAGWSGQLKAYDVTWTKEKINIVLQDQMPGSPFFDSDFCFNLLDPSSGRKTVYAEAPPEDGSYEFVVVGDKFVAFLQKGELKAVWPPIAESGQSAGRGVWGPVYKP